jgi:hypothetical protein
MNESYAIGYIIHNLKVLGMSMTHNLYDMLNKKQVNKNQFYISTF